MRQLSGHHRPRTVGRSRAPFVGLLAGVLALALVTAGCSNESPAGATSTETSAAATSQTSSAVTSSAVTSSAVTSSAVTSSAVTSSAAGEAGDQLSGTLLIFAAASLKATFDDLRGVFQKQHPKVTFPEITYDGSSTLATQIQDGAPADVFASADETNMNKVATLVADRVDFATNTLRIAVAPGNPKHITSLADIAAPRVLTVVCAPEVPCGAASHKALNAAGVDLKPVSEEQNVKAVLTKVQTGNADAGLVYATDINSAGDTVEGIDFPESAKAVNVYPIAALKDSKNVAAAQAFIELVTSAEGQKVLAGVGFGTP